MFYLPFGSPKGNGQVAHGSEDGNQGLDSVAVHHWLVLLVVFCREARLVDDSEWKINEMVFLL